MGQRMTIVEYVAKHAAEMPDKQAVLSPEGSVSWRELLRAANGYAAFLEAKGLKRQDVVVTRAANAI